MDHEVSKAELGAELAGLVDVLMSGDESSPEDGRVALGHFLNAVQQLAPKADQAGQKTLAAHCRQLVSQLSPWQDGQAALDEARRWQLEAWPTLVMVFLDEPTADNEAALKAWLDDPLWEAPAAAVVGRAAAGKSPPPGGASPPLADGVKTTATTAKAPAPDAAPAPGADHTQILPAWNFQGDTPPATALDPMLREILESELKELQAVHARAFAETDDKAAQRQAFEHYGEELERFAEALASLNMVGLEQACRQVAHNARAWGTKAPLPATDGKPAQWLDLVPLYLRFPGRAGANTLAQRLMSRAWPAPLAPRAAAAMAQALCQLPVLETGDGELEPRAQHAAPEDVSLQVPEDVNPELVDSLLQELPAQTAALSAATQRLVAPPWDAAQVDRAQRLAHTVKGAANTVGVRGVANLTHHMEDIYGALARHGAPPPQKLAETLIEATDCLESMSEALVGMGAPPGDGQRILQRILDWANAIDREGITADAPPAAAEAPAAAETQGAPLAVLPLEGAPEAEAPEATAPTAARDGAAAASAEGAGEATLRVPTHLVDELLRLGGESFLLTGQIEERVRAVNTQARLLSQQNRQLQQLSEELEQLVDVRNVLAPAQQAMGDDGFDPLEMDQYGELHTVTRRLVELANDAMSLDHALGENFATLETLLADQVQLHRDSQETVMRTRMVPVKSIVSRLQRSVRQTCRLTDKLAELTVKGADTPMDGEVLASLIDPLMHLLRNAVDHGIERPDKRQQSGKAPAGSIEMTFEREGMSIAVRCRDDGAGLDREAILRRGLERGLVGGEAVLSDEAIDRLILQPGFSTRSDVTQISGRGIGLVAVYQRVLELRGSLDIASEPGQGTTITLRLPTTLLSAHALLVPAGHQILAVANRGVEQLLYADAGALVQGDDGQWQLHQGHETHRAAILETLVGLPTPRDVGQRARPILMVRDEGGDAVAVVVDAILDSRDVVVKGLGAYVPLPRGLLGATILGDGSITAVLDLPALLRHPITETRRAAEGGELRQLCALVVDDSLSTRRALAQFVADLGYEVRTARDGLEAVGILDRYAVNVVLADLEMPRMNGLELTQHIRALEQLRDLPENMITSRAAGKHRREAEAAGVNAYLTKPYSEEGLLRHIQQAVGQH
ncbi:MAG: response regulator [Candidatus Competibacterales bacterium]